MNVWVYIHIACVNVEEWFADAMCLKE